MIARDSKKTSEREVAYDECIDGIHFTFARAVASDAKAIHDLMVRTQDAISCKDFYVISSLERVVSKLEKNSFAYLAIADGNVVGFYLFMEPGFDRKENLGYEIELSDNELNRVLCMDSVAIDPNYRGHGLQCRLAELGEKEGSRLGRDIYLATVDPRNTPSIRNFLLSGYDIVLVRESFYREGQPRVLLEKRADGVKPSFPSGDAVELH